MKNLRKAADKGTAVYFAPSAVAALEAALAQPAPPAEGEVGELVDWLRNHASAKGRTQRESFLRAADLLERQQPVPVSERLPGPEDCDAEGRCWWYGEGGDMVGWTYQDSEGLSYYRATHWLPAHALPVPGEEVEL